MRQNDNGPVQQRKKLLSDKACMTDMDCRQDKQQPIRIGLHVLMAALLTLLFAQQTHFQQHLGKLNWR